MKVWIDCSPVAEQPRLFGMTPLERLHRVLVRLKPAPSAIHADREAGPVGARLARFLIGAGPEPVLVLDGHAETDPRLIAFLAGTEGGLAAIDGEGAGRAAAFVLRPELADHIERQAASLTEIAQRLIAKGWLEALSQDRFPAFIAGLRRSVPYYLFGLPDAAHAREVERFLFRSNYKGSTDFLTKWVYPPLVWQLTLAATRWRLHPNWITLVSIILTFLAVPLFAQGEWLWGFLCAYGMSILDSVDGKVARVTMTDSALGNLMDHGLDIVHPPLWYFAIAWALAVAASWAQAWDAPVFQAAAWLFGFYVADRLVLAVSKARWGYGLHAHGAIDARIRTWISRRNMNLVLLTLGWLGGVTEIAFYAVVAWQGATLAWHIGRTIYLLATKPASVGK